MIEDAMNPDSSQGLTRSITENDMNASVARQKKSFDAHQALVQSQIDEQNNRQSSNSVVSVLDEGNFQQPKKPTTVKLMDADGKIYTANVVVADVPEIKQDSNSDTAYKLFSEGFNSLSSAKKEAQDNQLRVSLSNASTKNPDEVASALALSKKIGVGTDIVLRNKNSAQKISNSIDTNTSAMSISQDKELSQKIIDDPDFAAMAHNDILSGQLKMLSTVIRGGISQTFGTKMYGNSLIDNAFMPPIDYALTSDAFRAVIVGMKSKDLNRIDEEIMNNWGEIPTDRIEEYKNLNEFMEQNQESMTGIVGAPSGMLGQIIALRKELADYTAGGAAIGGTAGLLGGPFAEVTVPGGMATGAMYGFQGGMAAEFGRSAQVDWYRHLRESGMNHEDARDQALYVGMGTSLVFAGGVKLMAAPIVSIFQPLTAATSTALTVPTVATIVGTYLKQFGLASVGAFELGAGQSVVTDLATNKANETLSKNATPDQAKLFEDKNASAIFYDAIGSGLHTAKDFALLNALIPVLPAALSSKRMTDGIKGQEFLAKAIEEVSKTELAKRSPEKVNELLEIQLPEEVQVVYIDAGAFRTVLRDSGLTNEQIDKALPGVRDQLKTDALDVEIPTSIYLANEIARTDIGIALKDHTRVSVDAMDQYGIDREKRIMFQKFQDASADLIKKIKEAEEQNPEFKASAERLRVQEKANATANGLSEEEAEIHSVLVQAFAVNKAASMFEKDPTMTPEKFFAGYKLKVEKEQASAQGSFEQAQIAKMDSDYMAAVESANVVEQQRMVDEATSSPGWYTAQHGTPTKERISVFGNRGGLTGAESAKKAFFFSDRSGVTDTYRLFKRGVPNEKAINEWIDGLSSEDLMQVLTRDVYFNPDKLNDAEEIAYVKDALKEEARKFNEEEGGTDNYVIDEIIQNAKNSSVPFPSELDPKNIGQTLKVKLKITNPFYFTQEDAETFGIDAIVTKAIANGHDGIISKGRVSDSIANPFDDKDPPSGIIYAVFNPEQIKSADPVTRDESGNVVPLSRRFNLSSPNTFEQASRADLGLGDYRGEHTSPTNDGYAQPLDNLGGIFPDDIYSQDATRLYGTGNEQQDRQAISIIQSAKANKNQPIKIYRAVPLVLSNAEKIIDIEKQKAEILRRGYERWAKKQENPLTYDQLDAELTRLNSLPKEVAVEKPQINDGDWVAINKQYAIDHGESALNGKYRIITKTVPAKHLFTDGNSIQEWGYDSNSKGVTEQASRADLGLGQQAAPAPDSGVFDANNPPVSSEAIFALMDADGKIYYDISATMHGDLVETFPDITDTVIDGGFIVNGKYMMGKSDGGYSAFEGEQKQIDAVRNFTEQANTQGFQESNYRPAVVAWAKEKFGDRTAPDGSTVWKNFTEWFGDSNVVDAEGKPMVVYHGTKKTFQTFKSTDPNGLIYFSVDLNFSEKYASKSGGFRKPEADIQQRIDNARIAQKEITTPLYEELKSKYADLNDIPSEEYVAILEKGREVERSLLDGMTAAEADMRMGVRVIDTYIRASNIFDPATMWEEFLPVITEVLARTGETPISNSMMEYIKNGHYLIWENKDVVDAVFQKYDAIKLRESMITSGVDTIAVRDPSQVKSASANTGEFSATDPNILRQAAVRQTAMPSVTTINPVSPIGLAIASIPASGVESIKDSNTFFKKVWKKLLIATGKQIRSKSDESVKAVAKMAVADMQGFVSDNPQFANYYSQDWIKTRVLLDDYAGRPITSDEFLMFRVIDGLTSPNTMLPSNISDTVKMWTHWMNKGSFDEFLLGPKPITGTSVVFESAESVSGTTANIKVRTVKIIANLVKELGSVKAAIDYLREPVTVKELHAVNKTLGYAGNVSNIGNIRALVQMATGQDTLIPRMFIFGQKVGAYTLNSIGDERFTTVDIWESRYIRSFFSGMFENEIGLPVDEKEHNTFVRFGYAFKDEMERVTGKTWTPSSLQALRWFYIIAATRSAGYSKASTSETISTYTHRVLQSTFDYDQPRETNATNSTTTPPRRIEPKKYERNIDRDLDAKGITDPKQRQKITAGSWIQFTRSNRVGDEVGFQFDTDRSGVPRRSGSLSGLATVATHTPGVRLVDALTKAGVSAQPYVELEPTTEGVKTFSDLVRKINANSKFGTAVYVYSDADYAKKRLFISESGKSGFALSPDGDIVSVFSESGSREGRGAMILATQMGGTKLNCFDTMLPGYYAAHGFRAVARVPWNDEFIPAGWDFDAFGQYNGGRPDVVYMVYEEKYSKPYSNTDGVVVSNPDEAVAIQNKDIKTEADRAATSKAKYAQLVRPPSTEFAQSDQNKNQARGSIDLKKLTARLLSSSDMFTLGHEMAHFYLHVTMDMASKIDASQLIKDDAQRLLNWFGIKDIDTWNSMTLDEQRVHHEAFAYNFEIYLSEGRSPNEEMRGVFQRFKEFMIRTYLTLKEKLKETNAIYNQQFGKDLPILTGEIRQVMDRMIASKKQILEREAIDNFKAQWDTQEESGMDDARWAAYKEMEADAHNSSVEDLTKSSIQAMGLTSGDMTGMRLDFQKQHEQQRKQVRKEEIDKMSVEPIRLAERFLRTGKMTDQQGNDVEMTVGFKLDKESVSALYPMSDTGIKSKPDFNKLKGLLAAEDGLDPSVVAEMFGFTGGPDKFIRDLADLSKFKDELASRVDARMESEFGENTPEVIEEKIQVALHNKARERFVAVEQRWLAKLKTPVNVILKASREKAIEMLSKMRLMDIDPIKFAKAESMAALDVKTSTKLMQSEEVARKSAYTRSYNEQIGRGIDKDTAESEATRVGDEAAKRAKENIEDHKSKYGDVTPEVRAIKASNQRMLLNQLVSEAYKFKDIVAKFEKYAKKVISDPNRKRMGQESSEQIESILSRFGLLGYDIKPSSIPRPTLAEWISNQESKGLSVKDRFDPFVVDERHDIDYKEMTVDQFNGMVDAISIIEAVGKYESKMIKDAKNLAFKQVVPVVVESINSNSRSEPKTRRTPRPGSIAAKKQSVNRFMLQQQRGPNLCRVLDGDNVDGIMTSLLVLSMDANDSREFNFIQRTTKILNDLLAPVIAEGKLSEGEISFGNFKSADHPDGRSFNKEERLAIALNFGNESNAQRVMSGESLTASQVVEVLQTLTSKDWDFVEGVWKHFDEYRPLADALEKKMYGKGLDLVEPREFTILLPDGKFRDISGGYYPLKYDPNAWQNKQDYAAINELNSQRMAAMGAATTSRSYSKARVVRLENKPLLLNMNAMYSGFSEVMHDIVWREWLIESNRVVENSSIREAIIKNYDKPFHTAMKDWIKGIAMGTKSPQIESSLTYFRHNAVSSLMVGKVANIWKHSFDITKTVSTLSGDKTPMEGWKWVLGSLGHVLTSPLEATKEAFDNSPELRHRFSTRFRELNEIKNQVQGQSKTKTFMYTHGLMFHHMLWKVTDVWTWQAAAKKFLSEGKTPEVAYKLADRVLKDSQGSGTVGNLALIEQGGPAMKLFTALSHYFINTSNILYTKTMTRKTGVSGMSKYAMDITQALIVPVILEEVARHMISYSIHHKQKDKHELDADVLMKEYAAAQAIYLLGTVPIAREFAPAADVLITGNYRTYEGPLGMKIVPDTIKAAFQLRQAKADKELRKALLNILGDVTGLPTSQTNATIDGIEALISGESRSPLAPIMGIPR